MNWYNPILEVASHPFIRSWRRLLVCCIYIAALISQVDAQTPISNRRQLWGSIADESVGELTNIANLKTNNGKLLLSWRMLPTESYETAFDLFRQNGSGWNKINTEPIRNSTNYQVPAAHVNVTADNTYKLTYHGSEEALDTYTIKADQVFNKKPYVSLFLKETMSDPRINDVEEYIINDGGVADLDGDGQYEILLVRHAKGAVEVDEGVDIGTGGTVSKSPAILEAYKLDGTLLWRTTFGPNISVSNAIIFIAADFNGDGKDEIAIRTSEGTSFGNNVTIGDTNNDGRTVYARPGYYNSEAPEFLSILDGMTGAELARAPHIAIGTSQEWGDSYFKRANSLRLAGAKLKAGNKWQIVTGRGVYGKMVLEAWEYNGPGQDMTKLWRFDTDANNREYRDYEGQGNHQLVVADVDGDGFDEITYGACAIDHDGKGLYTTKLGHGDMLHVGKFDPDRPGLQTYQCYESGLTRSSLRDAGTGQQIWALVGNQPGDEGRALIADIDPTSRGYEAWVFDRVVYDIKGNPTGGPTALSPNFPIWWTGSLNRQRFDDRTIDQYNRNGGNARVFTMWRYPIALANSTKNNVTFMGDIFGDWREEIIIARQHPTDNSGSRPIPGSTELMIFSTWHPTEYKFPYLMSDDVYYRAAVHQNVGYNSPSHLGFYLGSDMPPQPISPKQQVDRYWSGTSNMDWDKSQPNWLDASSTSASFADGNTVMFNAKGSTAGDVVLGTDIVPGKVWFANPAGKDYRISGTGKLTGTMELTKLMEGIVTLNGSHSYTGQTLVDEGVLRINGQFNSPFSIKEKGNLGGTGSLLSGLTLAKGKSVIDAGIRPGFGSTSEADLGTLTIVGNLVLPGGNNLEFDILPGTTKRNDQLLVNGNFTASEVNNIIVNFPNNQPVAGTYVLVKVSGTLQATASNFQPIGIVGRPFSLLIADGEIRLVIEEQRAAGQVVWKGDVNNIWDNSTANFLHEGIASPFVFEDQVLFNNTAVRKDIVLNESVVSKGLQFDSGDYTLSGNGIISGAGGIMLGGTANKSLSILLDKNTYTGKNEFKNGSVTVQHIGLLGEVSSLGVGSEESKDILLDQAGLHVLGNSITNRNLKLSGTNTLGVAEGQSLVMQGTIEGSGQVIKNGKGTLGIDVVNPLFSGNTLIKDGIISLRSAAANQTGLGGGNVTLEGGTLQLYNTTNSDLFEQINWNIIVPQGATAGLRVDGRSSMNGTLTGSGTLNLDIPFARTELKGNWSAFQGTINVFGDGPDFRVENTTGYPNATVNLQKGTIYPETTTGVGSGLQFGALSGEVGTVIRGRASGTPFSTLTIGNKNIDAEFKGNIGTKIKLIKVGTGTQVLSGSNLSVSGGTANNVLATTEVRAGRLLVNNNAAENVGLGNGAITVSSGAILGGTGSAAGAITIQSGGTLQPGSRGIGTFTAKSNLIFAADSKVEVDLNKRNEERDKIIVTETVTYNGTLIVNNMGNQAIVLGDNFSLFQVGSASGNFTAIQPASPGLGLLWSFIPETGILTVVRDPDYVPSRDQTIDFPEIGTFTFEQNSTTLSATASSMLPVTYSSSNTNVARVNGNRLEFVGVGTATITASQAGNDDFDPVTGVTREIIVNKGRQTISFGELPSMLLATTGYGLIATSTAGLAVSFSVEDPAIATVNNNVLTLLKPGSTRIIARQVGSALWEAATEVAQELVINKNTQAITFPALRPVTFDVGSAELLAASGSGLPVTYSSDNTAIAKVNGNRIEFVGVGLVNITATQAGDDRWMEAAPATQPLSIAKGVQIITFAELPTLFVDGDPYTLSATSSSQLPVTFQSQDPSIATIVDGKVVTTQSGNTTIVASQPGNELWAPANIVARNLTVAGQAVAEGQVEVVKLITPNGDGQNDVLLIQGIESFPDNTVRIFDRQGQLLFSADGYDNQAVVFRGLSRAGQPLTAGTYFYSIEYRSKGKKETKTGWFYLTK